MNTLMSILMVVQNAASTGKGAADMYNQTGYSMAVIVFIAFIILLFIAVAPVKHNKDKHLRN